ncbi:glycoside hydrolase [Opitutaceae bacterium TAV5]|nr:glycoside hydrolase [Opitutaceae bacterium TAV5]
MQSSLLTSLSPESPAARLLSSAFLADPALQGGLDEIAQDHAHRFSADGDGVTVRFVLNPHRGSHISIRQEDPDQDIHVSCGYPVEAFRALGIIIGRLEAGETVSREETCAFDMLGVMLDVSRNGVLRPESVRKFIRHLALMGIRQLMLYTEDTYEIPGEPLFGYFRGRYTRDELRAIDDYAFLFGIEVIPCIQALGHLEQVLQWPVYRAMQDTAGVLLVGDATTDAFVEKMIAAAAAPFRSRRIHLGMDEAHGIGSGNYRVRNGLRSPFEILTDHLRRTGETCRRLGLRPMIWSDMFFRLGSRTNDYYDRDSVIAPETIARVPADVDLVYWDYYHTDPAFYGEWIARHRAMGKEPVFAGGIWTWNRPWPQLPHSLATLRAGMEAARGNGLREAFVTMWGDDGMEGDAFSALPAIQYFAELGYGNPAEADQNLPVHFNGSSDADADVWIAAGELDLVPGENPAAFYHANPAKWLLWHDPLLGFLDRHVRPSFPEHFERIAARCAEWSDAGSGNALLDYPGQVAAVLALKCRLHLALRPAYRAGDHPLLRRLLQNDLPALRREVVALRQLHEARWHAIYRPFGWEVLERRYAGLLSRLETLGRRLRSHLADPACRIEELECESVPVWPAGALFRTTLTHHQAATPSRIF